MAKTIKRSSEQTRGMGPSLPSTVLDAVNDAILVVDSRLQITYFNRSAEDLFGFESGEIRHKPLDAVLPGFEAAAKEGKSGAPREFEALHKSGRTISIEASISPYNTGPEIGLILILRDITARKKAQELLREGEEKFRTIFESANVGKSLTLPSGEISVNKALADMIGYEREELSRKTWQSITPNEDIEDINKKISGILRGETDSARFEKRYIHKNGPIVWGDISIAAHRDPSGKVMYFITTVVDITRRKEAEIALGESEARFRLLAESAPMGIGITDKNLKIVYLSSGFTRIFGYTLEDISSVAEWYRLAYPDPRQRAEIQGHWDKALRMAAESGKEIDPQIVPITCKDGKILQVDFRFKASNDLFFFLLTDVSERVAAEKEIIRQKDILQLFIEHSPAAIAMFDREMRYIAVSRRFMQDYDVPDMDLIGKSHYEVFPEIPEVIKEVHRHCLAGAVESSEDDRFPRASGKIDYMRWEMRPWFEREGEIGGVILFSEVVTQRILAEQAAENYIERLKILHAVDQAILQSGGTPDKIAGMALEKSCLLLKCQRAAAGIVAPDFQTIQLDIFNAGNNLLRRTEKILNPGEQQKLANLKVGQIEVVEDTSNLIKPSFMSTVLEMTNQAASINLALHSEERLVGLVSYGWDAPATINPDMVEVVVEVGREIAIAVEQASLRRATAAHAAELEKKVLERTAELEASNKDLEAFAYSVSHDLRAPLRNILSFSQILEEDFGPGLDDEGRRVLGIIQNSTRKMDQLITDLLSLSRTSRAHMELKTIDMTAMARSVYEEIAGPEVRQKFTFKVTRLPACRGDPTLIRQLWTNLISNAIKYTVPKSDCRIEISGSIDSGGEMLYTVRDSGVGFDEAHKDHLFRLFQRLHRESEFEGTGVGLAIVQRIVQRHGGRVWAEGRVDEGAAFHFALPARDSF